jgi:hypothetical protein
LLARYLYFGAVGASLLAAAIASILILTTGTEDVVPTAGPFPVSFDDQGLVRPLAAIIVVLAALWFAALAASRVDRAPTN